MYAIQKFPKGRKHTLCFLKNARHNAPVVLSTEIDVSAVVAARNNAPEGHRVSYISFFISAISQILEKYPLANAFYQSGLFPKIVSLQRISAKFTVDTLISETRAVVSAVIHNANKLTLAQIQEHVEQYKKSDFATDKNYAAIRLLHVLPLFLGKILFGRVMRSPKKSVALQGSFTITSLGHQPIDLFIPISGSTLAFGVGQIKERAVVEHGKIQIRNTVILTMVFDHRVMDGAYASDLLCEIKNLLTNGSTT